MKKKIFLSIALIFAGILSAAAQNNVLQQERLAGQSLRFESSGFGNPKLPAIKKANSIQDWWEPDTVYCYILPGCEDETGFIDRFIFKYNSHGLLEKETHQCWDCVNDSWGCDEINAYTYTFDSNGNVVTKSVVNKSLFTYTYDSNNNRLTELQQSWVNDSWVNVSLCTYTYDSNNNILTKLPQNWQNDSWVNSSFYTYTYDSNNKRLTGLEQFWKNDSWENFFLKTYTYDSGNNIKTELLQMWLDNSWENTTLITYICDSDNNWVTELRQRWLNSWENFDQYLRTYDENRNGTSVEYWRFSEKGWLPANNLMTGFKIYYNNMQSYFWGGDCKMTASYIKVSDLITGIEPATTPESNAISLYPNPTSGELRIKNYELGIKNIQVFDMAGINVFNTQQLEFNISRLPAGLYFVKITTDKGVVTKKIVKR